MRYDSSGTFTVAPERRQWILPDPHLAIVKLVQVAVAHGASRIDIRTDVLGVSAAFDGGNLSMTDDLAMAVHAPLGRVARQIELITGGTQTVWNARGTWRSAVAPGPVNRYRLSRNTRAAAAVFNRLLVCPEPALLQSRCRYAPLPVLVNGRRINPPDLGDNLEETYILAEEGDCEPVLAPATSRAQRPPRLPARCVNGRPVPCREVRLKRPGAPGQALYLKHGVVVASEPLADGEIHLRSCAGLTLDLTGFALVKNEAWQSTCAATSELAAPCEPRCAASSPPGPPCAR